MTLSRENRGYGTFFAISGCDTHFRSELCRMAGDKPLQDNLRMKFSALNVDIIVVHVRTLKVQGDLHT